MNRIDERRNAAGERGTGEVRKRDESGGKGGQKKECVWGNLSQVMYC